MEVIMDSKVNKIADVKLGLLLTEQQFILNKLEMTQKAIECAEFLEKYFLIIENRHVNIEVTAKEIDLTLIKQ